MLEWCQKKFIELLSQVTQVETDVVLLVGLLVCAVIVLDGVSLFTRKLQKEVGLDRSSDVFSIDGSKEAQSKNYVSEIQGLAGRPDAIIVEDGYFIPIERKPLAKKIRDRHIAQLLVYMRLVEEFEGKKPPYGYLIVGKQSRKVKIYNSESRQQWLQKQIDEMRAIALEQNAAVASPHPKKCSRCAVRESCQFRAASPEDTPVQIGSGQSSHEHIPA